MVFLREIKTQHKQYPFIEQLLHAAFPKNERRDDEKQRLYTDCKHNFHCLLIEQADNIPVGVLTYWDFNNFFYIEHFAISSSLRRQGWGTKAIKNFFNEHSQKPIVLEVEHPTNEESIRRISFYKQCGLSLWSCNYLQPPYRESDEWFPLYLMVSDGLCFEKDYADIQQTIHSQVYGVKTNEGA